MTPPSLPSSRFLSTATMTLVCLLALPLKAHAKGPKGMPHGKRKASKEKHYKENDRDRQVDASHPRPGFVLTFGTGYAGQGYYYGPPNSPYYYERSDVRYDASREAAPREYFRNEEYRSGTMDSAVQRELARRGHYHGYIDGQIEPQSRRAIAGDQRDQGLRPAGLIDSGLLHSLGLR